MLDLEGSAREPYVQMLKNYLMRMCSKSRSATR